MPSASLQDSRLERQTDLDTILELSQSFIDEIESYMSPRCVISTAVAVRLGVARQLERFAGNLHFGHGTDPCNSLHHMPVAVATGEIHPPVDTPRIFPQCLLDSTDAFHKLAPVDSAQSAQAIDTVGDGNLVCCLLLVSQLNHLIDRLIRLGQPLLYPC